MTKSRNEFDHAAIASFKTNAAVERSVEPDDCSSELAQKWVRLIRGNGNWIDPSKSLAENGAIALEIPKEEIKQFLKMRVEKQALKYLSLVSEDQECLRAVAYPEVEVQRACNAALFLSKCRGKHMILDINGVELKITGTELCRSLVERYYSWKCPADMEWSVQSFPVSKERIEASLNLLPENYARWGKETNFNPEFARKYGVCLIDGVPVEMSWKHPMNEASREVRANVMMEFGLSMRKAVEVLSHVMPVLPRSSLAGGQINELFGKISRAL